MNREFGNLGAYNWKFATTEQEQDTSNQQQEASSQ
jgi:3-methyladenine DNA glycosylase Tag